jgi:hypothetical protein
VRLDPAVVQLHHRAEQRQADPESAVRPGERLVALDEEVEDPRQHLRLDAVAVVGHPNHRLVADSFHLEADVAAAGRILRGVAEQVGLHLLQARGVADDRNRVVVDVHFQV